MGSFTWTGKELNSSWKNGKNWDPEGVPEEHAEITVPGPPYAERGPTVPRNRFPLKKLELLEKGWIDGSTLVVEEQFDWGGKLLCGVRVADGAVLRITSPEKWLGRGAVLEIAGTAEVEDDVSSLGGVGNIEISEGSVIRNLGTFTARASVVFHWAAGATSIFENLGTFAVSSSPVGLTSVAVTFDDAAFVCEGVVDVQGDATLRLIDTSGTHSHTLRSGTRVVGDGRVVVDGWKIEIQGFPSIEPGANLEIARDGFLTVSQAQPISVPSQLQCKGKLFWTGGSIAAPVTVMAGATLSIEGRGEQRRLARGAKLENIGTAEYSGEGRIDMDDGSTLINRGNFTIRSTGTLLWLGGARGAFFLNGGSFVNSIENGTTEIGSIAFANSGTVELKSGTLRFTEGATYKQTAGKTLLAGGGLIADSTLEIQGGVLSGVGTIGASVSNAGTVNPGPSTGALTIVGDYAQSTSGTLALEIGSPMVGIGFHQLIVEGTAALDGKLVVEQIGSFVIRFGDLITVLRAGVLKGRFASADLPELEQRLFFSPIYSDTDLVFLVNEDNSWGAKAGIKDTVPIDGDPKDHPKYIQNAIKGVGTFGLGGAFRLDQQVVDGTGVGDSIFLERQEFHLDDDPLKDQDFALNLVYESRSAADVALAGSEGRLKYAFYIGPGELIYPTVISDTTAPALCAALRKVLETERTDAQAAERLAIDLLFWYVGARFLPKTAEMKPNFATSVSVGAGSTPGGKQALVFVEIGAGDLKASIDLAKNSGAKVVAVDPVVPVNAEAIRQLEALGGTFVEGTAESLSPGIADKVLQYFPWSMEGSGAWKGGGDLSSRRGHAYAPKAQRSSLLRYRKSTNRRVSC